MTTFTGFSEEDLLRMKISEGGTQNGFKNLSNGRRIDKIGLRSKKTVPSEVVVPSPDSDEAIRNVFDKCSLKLMTPTTTQDPVVEKTEESKNETDKDLPIEHEYIEDINSRRSSTNVTPDVIRCIDNYTEDELEIHKVKLEELQLKQKLMEEQNKKRKEMLSKALADRTKQTAEEVLKLEKIKKELEVLDGQLSKDVAMLRKKIDQACVNYAEAEKQYLKIEKEFLQAKINLQKEKDKKELLIEHLCTLITHNETRKAEKLETLMLELANDKNQVNDGDTTQDESPVIIDGVDQRTGKMMEFYPQS